MPAHDAYRQALLDARRRLLAIDADAGKKIADALDAYVREVAQAAGRDGSQVIAHAEARLRVALTDAVDKGRRLSFTDTLYIWQAATEEAAARTDVPDRLFGGIRVAPLTILQAFEAQGRGAVEQWKTLLRSYHQDAVGEVRDIIRQATVEGVSTDELAKRLRLYVVGAEPFHDVFEGLAIDDKNIRRDVRGKGRQMRYNAERIAFTETGNLRHEAEIFHFAQDPMVAAVEWQLSPNRGEVVTPDECDILAETDFYGLGPGIYPLGTVPKKPHPFDRCELFPRTRASTLAGAPKPHPRRRFSARRAMPKGARDMSQHALDRIRESAEQAIRFGEEAPVLNVPPGSAPPPPVPPTPAPVSPPKRPPRRAKAVNYEPSVPGFTAAAKIEDAIAYALEVLKLKGVSYEPSKVPKKAALLSANLVNEALKAAKDAGIDIANLRLTVGTPKQFGAPGPWSAAFFPGRDAIGFNVKNAGIRTGDLAAWKAETEKQQKLGWWSTGNHLATVWHEIGHFLHWRRVKGSLTRWLHLRTRAAFPAEFFNDVKLGDVSTYGMTSPTEFVAEVFAGLMSKRTFSPAVMRWFKFFGGVTPGERP